MNSIIKACLSRVRTVLMILVLSVIWGALSYINIPKESTPDVKIPVIHTSVRFDGISPQDADRLIVRPIENEVRSIEGVKNLKSTAYEGGANVVLEFQAGLNTEKALSDVRDKVDIANSYLPVEADDPIVSEVNLSTAPIFIIKLSGNIPNRSLYKIAKDLKDEIEAEVKQVLKAEVVGDREEVVEAIIKPEKISSYALKLDELINIGIKNNQLITAGNLETKTGNYPIKVPGVLENVIDIMNMGVIATSESVIRIKDIADVRKTFKDPIFFARDRGIISVAIEVSKRSGENLIETVDAIKKIVSEKEKNWPKNINVDFAQDKSDKIKEMLLELQNSIILAVILVMIVIVASLGWRSAIIVGIAVPCSFLMGIMVISFLGYTVNIVVLFSLIFAVGMLVDGAIIVVEYADKKIINGISPKKAYLQAAQQMAWPVITSISTILVVFLPLLFWPGVIGQFMKFMPITLLATLTASILMAIIFIPSIGSLMSFPNKSEETDLFEKSGLTNWYVKKLNIVINHPKRVLGFAILLLFSIKIIHGYVGKGTEFFPDVEPEEGNIHVHARGNLSIYEKDAITKEVAEKIYDMKELKSIYSKSGAQSRSIPKDVVGVITLEFIDWKERRKVYEISKEIEERTKNIPGVYVEVLNKKPGPPSSKPIFLEFRSWNYEKTIKEVSRVKKFMESLSGLKGVEDSRPLPGIEWKIKVDRSEALKFGTNVTNIGAVIRLVTNGAKVSSYRPDDSKDEVDIFARYPKEYRKLSTLDGMNIQTPRGRIPISHFVKREASNKISEINRSEGVLTFEIKSDVEKDILASDKLLEIKEWIKNNPVDPDVNVVFRGEDEDKKETGDFLVKAFSLALFMIAIILVTQFNSFFSMGIVLSSVVMSTAGVFFGLIVQNLAFGVVMGGIGVIALAGIIVSNNIILIDTFDNLRKDLPKVPKFSQLQDIIIETCKQRLRPVILTKITTILGLLPIMLRINIDFINLEVTYGAPSTEWWVLLSTCIIYGVLFASSLTLFVTPCALILRAKRDVLKGRATEG